MDEQESGRDTLARVDERTRAIQSEVIHLRDDFKLTFKSLAEEIKNSDVRNAALYRDVDDSVKELDKKMDEMQKEFYSELEKNFVRREVFDPIKKIVYGVVSIVMVAVITALLSLVVLRSPSTPKAHAEISIETPSH